MRKFILLAFSLTALATIACKKSEPSRGDARLEVDTEELNVPKDESSRTVVITSNCYWDIEVSDTAGRPAAWVSSSVSKGSGDCDLILQFSPNVTTSMRVALVKISTQSSAELTKVIRVSQEKGEKPATEGYTFPICQTIDIDNPKSHKLVNATLSGNMCLFKAGMAVTWLRGGGDNTSNNISWFCPSHTQPASGTEDDRSIHRSINFDGFAVNKENKEKTLQVDTILIEIPVKDALFGDLRLMLGARSASFTEEGWEYYWSKDNTNWNKILIKAAETPGSDAVWNIIYFSIPEADRVPAGGNLSFRLVATGSRGTKTNVAISNTICVCKAKADASNLPPMDLNTVAYSHGFDDLIDCKGAYVELPIGWMCSATTGYASNYTSFNTHYICPDEYKDILDTKGCYGRPGYLQVGYYDESLWTRQCIGTYTIKIGERMKAMGVSLADAKLSFKVAEFKDFRGYDPVAQVFVKCGADSTAIATTTGSFVSASVNYTDLTQTSEIIISSHKLSADEIAALGRGDNAKNLIDNRFYLEDVLVELTDIKAKGSKVGNSNDDFTSGGIYKW